MKNIKVLGTGCSRCKTTLQLIADIARAESVSIELEKVEDPAEIMRYGVMATPAVVISDTVVHAGGIPLRKAIVAWLSENDAVN